MIKFLFQLFIIVVSSSCKKGIYNRTIPLLGPYSPTFLRLRLRPCGLGMSDMEPWVGPDCQYNPLGCQDETGLWRPYMYQYSQTDTQSYFHIPIIRNEMPEVTYMYMPTCSYQCTPVAQTCVNNPKIEQFNTDSVYDVNISHKLGEVSAGPTIVGIMNGFEEHSQQTHSSNGIALPLPNTSWGLKNHNCVSHSHEPPEPPDRPTCMATGCNGNQAAKSSEDNLDAAEYGHDTIESKCQLDQNTSLPYVSVLLGRSSGIDIREKWLTDGREQNDSPRVPNNGCAVNDAERSDTKVITDTVRQPQQSQLSSHTRESDALHHVQSDYIDLNTNKATDGVGKISGSSAEYQAIVAAEHCEERESKRKEDPFGTEVEAGRPENEGLEDEAKKIAAEIGEALSLSGETPDIVDTLSNVSVGNEIGESDDEFTDEESNADGLDPDRVEKIKDKIILFLGPATKGRFADTIKSFTIRDTIKSFTIGLRQQIYKGPLEIENYTIQMVQVEWQLFPDMYIENPGFDFEGTKTCTGIWDWALPVSDSEQIWGYDKLLEDLKNLNIQGPRNREKEIERNRKAKKWNQLLEGKYSSFAVAAMPMFKCFKAQNILGCGQNRKSVKNRNHVSHLNCVRHISVKKPLKEDTRGTSDIHGDSDSSGTMVFENELCADVCSFLVFSLPPTNLCFISDNSASAVYSDVDMHGNALCIQDTKNTSVSGSEEDACEDEETPEEDVSWSNEVKIEEDHLRAAESGKDGAEAINRVERFLDAFDIIWNIPVSEPPASLIQAGFFSDSASLIQVGFFSDSFYQSPRKFDTGCRSFRLTHLVFQALTIILLLVSTGDAGTICNKTTTQGDVLHPGKYLTMGKECYNCPLNSNLSHKVAIGKLKNSHSEMHVLRLINFLDELSIQVKNAKKEKFVTSKPPLTVPSVHQKERSSSTNQCINCGNPKMTPLSEEGDIRKGMQTVLIATLVCSFVVLLMLWIMLDMCVVGRRDERKGAHLRAETTTLLIESNPSIEKPEISEEVLVEEDGFFLDLNVEGKHHDQFKEHLSAETTTPLIESITREEEPEISEEVHVDDVEIFSKEVSGEEGMILRLYVEEKRRNQFKEHLRAETNTVIVKSSPSEEKGKISEEVLVDDVEDISKEVSGEEDVFFLELNVKEKHHDQFKDCKDEHVRAETTTHLIESNSRQEIAEIPEEILHSSAGELNVEVKCHDQFCLHEVSSGRTVTLQTERNPNKEKAETAQVVGNNDIEDFSSEASEVAEGIVEQENGPPSLVIATNAPDGAFVAIANDDGHQTKIQDSCEQLPLSRKNSLDEGSKEFSTPRKTRYLNWLQGIMKVESLKDKRELSSLLHNILDFLDEIPVCKKKIVFGPKTQKQGYPAGTPYGVHRRRMHQKQMKMEGTDNQEEDFHPTVCEKSRVIRRLVKFSEKMPDVRKCQQTFIKTFCNDSFMRREVMKCMRMSPKVRNFELLRLLVFRLRAPSLNVVDRNLRTFAYEPVLNSILQVMQRGHKEHGVFKMHHHSKPLSTNCDRGKNVESRKTMEKIQPLDEKTLKEDEFVTDENTKRKLLEESQAISNDKSDQMLINETLKVLIRRSDDKSCDVEGCLVKDDDTATDLFEKHCFMDHADQEAVHISSSSNMETKPIKKISSGEWIFVPKKCPRNDRDKLGSCEPFLEDLALLPAVGEQTPEAGGTEIKRLSTKLAQVEANIRGDKAGIPKAAANHETIRVSLLPEKSQDIEKPDRPFDDSFDIDNDNREEEPLPMPVPVPSAAATEAGPLKPEIPKVKVIPPRQSPNGEKIELYCHLHLNNPAVKKRLKKKEKKDAFTHEDVKRIIRDHTWLPLDKLPPPRIELTSGIVGNVTYAGLDAIFRQIALGNTPGPAITMKYELLRLCTLRNYPKVNKPYLIRLSASGFYYAADGDEVVCYCCGIRRNGWSESDVPDDVHKRLSPKCSFFFRNSQVNYPVPRQVEGATNKFAFLEEFIAPQLDDEGEDVSNDYTGPARRQQEMQRNKEPPVVTNGSRMNTSSLGVNTESPKHPHYAVKTVRLNSYVGWPASSHQDPTVLAEAGFYFAGIGDCVRCFFCGVGLRHWAAEDNPWIEHARWSQTCSYLKQYKGEEFINLVHMAIQITRDEEPSAPGSQPNEETTKVLMTDAAQSVLEMGYDARIIRKAIDAILRENGRSGVTAQRIMEKVLEIEEQESAEPSREMQQLDLNRQDTPTSSAPSDSNASVSHAQATLVQGAGAGAQSGKDGKADSQAGKAGKKSASQSKDKSGKASASGKTGQDPKKIKEENEKLKEQTLCKICMDRTVCIVFLPCGHLVTCAECAPALRKCPICRSLVKGTVKTYMS